MSTRRGFLKGLSAGIAAALLAGNLALGSKPALAADEMVGRFPLRVESLDRTLRNVTFRMEHVTFWKKMPKSPQPYNTVEEHSRVSGVGTLPTGDIEGQITFAPFTTFDALPVRTPWWRRAFQRRAA